MKGGGASRPFFVHGFDTPQAGHFHCFPQSSDNLRGMQWGVAGPRPGSARGASSPGPYLAGDSTMLSLVLSGPA